MTSCFRCQRPLPIGHVGGNCPVCLLDSALGDGPAEEVSTDLPSETPIMLGEYEILGEIGRGGTSVVYRARQQSVNRVVALKTLHGAALTSRDAFERLRIEAHAIARLDHPHIVPLYEIGRDAGFHFLSLRYFERGSLAQALTERRFAPRDAARLISTAARAVHHAHQRGVLHRDLKPSNLLLDEQDQPHVTDFGLAKLADGDTSLTLSTSVLGTPSYMAPEQAAGFGKEASVPADLHSLGAILFELLTGRPPFLGQTALEVLRQVADDEPPPLRKLNPALDADIEAICLHCLEKEPAKRYATAVELADDLDRWLRHESLSIRHLTGVERAIKWTLRRPLVASLIAAVVLALFGGIVSTTWQWRIAKQGAELARLNAYVADMDLVQRIYRKEPGRAETILNRHRPRPGETDWRGWEWRYFWQGCRGEKPEHSWRCTNALFSMAITADGRNLVVGEIEGGMRIFDSQTLDPVYQSPGLVNLDLAPYRPSGNRVGARVQLIPGTSLIAWSETTGVTNCVVRFWDIQARAIVRTLPQPYIVRNMAATPDGKKLVITYQTPHGEAFVWNLANDSVVTKVGKRPGNSNFTRGNPLAVSPDSRLMTLDDFPDHLRIMNIDTGAEHLRLPLDDQYFLSASFSPDGKTLAVHGGFNKGSFIQFWDVATGQHKGNLDCEAGWIEQILYSPDGKMLASASTDQTIRLWNTETMEPARVIRWNAGDVASMAFSPDGRYLYSGSGNGVLSRWDLSQKLHTQAQGRLPRQFQKNWHFLPGSNGILGIMTNGLATNGLAVEVSGPAWDQVKILPQLGTNCTALDILGDSSGYVIGYYDGQVDLRRSSDGTMLKQFNSFTSAVGMVQVLPRTGRVVALCQSLARVWDISDGTLRCEFPYPPGETCAAFTPDEKAMTIVSFNGSVLTFDLTTGRQVSRRLPSGGVSGFAYSSKGGFAATCGPSAFPQLYTAENLAPVGPLGENMPGGFALAFSPDGRRLAIAKGASEAVQLYDVRSRRQICSLPADIDLSIAISFSPDGNVLAQSGSVLRAVYLWRAPSWEEIAKVEAAGD